VSNVQLLFMCSLNEVHEINTYSADHVCLSDRPFDDSTQEPLNILG
jgi:hypothetical protein